MSGAHLRAGFRVRRCGTAWIARSRWPGTGITQPDTYVSDPETADQDSVFPLHAAELSQVYGLQISPELDADIAGFLERHPAPADGVVAGRVFSRLLATGRRVAGTLDWLEENGCLVWLIPEFRGLVNLIPYDAAHDYTVGTTHCWSCESLRI